MAYMIISHPDPSPCVVCRVDYANLQFEMTHAPVGTSYGLLSQCPPLCRTRRKLQHGVETLPESQSQGSKHRVQISAATQWRLNCHQVCHRGHCYSPARVEKKQKHWKKNNPRLRDNNCRYTLSGDANQNHSPTFGKLPEKKHPDIFQKKKKNIPQIHWELSVPEFWWNFSKHTPAVRSASSGCITRHPMLWSPVPSSTGSMLPTSRRFDRKNHGKTPSLDLYGRVP